MDKSIREKKTVYYSDERNDEFSGISKKTVTIDKDFPFLHKSPLWKAAAFFVYRVIMTPFAYIYCKLKFRLKIVNREAFKKCKKSGYFLYRNHTLTDGDAFIPNLAVFPKDNYTIVNADNVSTPGTKNFILMCGAIPIPQGMAAYHFFSNAVEKRILQKHCVTVYPEAHIWPYYTGIRRFSNVSFTFPARFDVPVFTATTTFSEPMKNGVPKVTVYVDGPFYPDKSEPRKTAQKLCDTVYETMKMRSAFSTCEAVKYVKRETDI